jgi:hypothetical protein
MCVGTLINKKGIYTKGHNLSTLIGDGDSWGYIACGKKYHNSIEEVYGETYGAKDKITIIWDSKKGKISFKKNGKKFGVAYDKVKGEMYFGFSYISITKGKIL